MSKNVLLKFGVGIIASVTAISSTVVPATAQNEKWLTMGKSNGGSILSLDVNSIQTKPHTGNWLWFSYRVTTSKETQEYIGYTASCVRGKISKEPQWYVDDADKQGASAEALSIKADSPGSQTLLTKVCQISNSAKSALSPRQKQQRESRVQLELDGCFRARIEAETELEAMQPTGGADNMFTQFADATIRNRQRLIESQYETCVRQAQAVD